MDGTEGLGAGLATLAHALDGRKAALLDELRRVEQDLEATKRALDAAVRMGFGSVTSHAVKGQDVPVQAAPASRSKLDVGSRPPAWTSGKEISRVAEVIRMPGRPIPPSPAGDFEVHREALASLGPVRDDRGIPPKVNPRGLRVDTIGMPTGAIEMEAIRDSLQAISQAVVEAPPGLGARRYPSARGLVPGDAIAPTLRKILQAADRPLCSLEVATAFLQVRNLRLEDRDLVAIVNRVSSLLAQDAKAGRVSRIRTEGTRLVRWIWSGKAERQPSGLPG